MILKDVYNNLFFHKIRLLVYPIMEPEFHSIVPVSYTHLTLPTTGLHFADVEKLMYVLNRLTDEGNTVVVIEHNLDVIKCADHIIDLGPEGGSGGGTIVATGTPEEVAKCEKSFTGQYLRKMLR